MEFVCRLLPERGVWFFSWSKILLGLWFVSPHWADRETLYGCTKYLSWIPLFPRSLSVVALSFQFCLKASNSSSSRLFLSLVDARCSSKFLIKLKL